MVMPKWLHRLSVLCAAALITAASGARAQVLPVMNIFSGRTFEGTVDVSWPVLFDGCTFRTDGTVIKHSYGAVFRNCTFECTGSELFIAESGDGIILADCEVKGCEALSLSREFSPASRNYIAGVTVNGDECTVLDEQETITDIDGLELADCVRGESDGPMFMIMSADKNVLREGEIAYVHIRGLEKGMFVGWQSSDKGLKLTVDEDGMGCRVYAAQVKDLTRTVISAYTEYGLEAAVEITIGE